jgi:hypothetical protein
MRVVYGAHTAASVQKPSITDRELSCRDPGARRKFAAVKGTAVSVILAAPTAVLAALTNLL